MKRFLVMLIAALTIVGTSFGEEDTVNGVTYNYSIEFGLATITGKSISEPAISRSTTGALVIPDMLGGCPVIAIGDGAFSGCESLTSIKIPEGVTSIGDGAFNGCESLKSITIPKSVTEIGEVAFARCPDLKSIDVSDDNSVYRSVDGVLYSKDERVLFAVPGARTAFSIPKSVTTIGNGAFWGCESLTSIMIPKSVTAIGVLAFMDCGLQSISVEWGDSARIRRLLKDSFENVVARDLLGGRATPDVDRAPIHEIKPPKMEGELGPHHAKTTNVLYFFAGVGVTLFLLGVFRAFRPKLGDK